MPTTLPMQTSELAHLLSQISDEYEAAQRGLSGLAQGTAQHQFITRRMERIGELHSQLQTLVGDEAMALIAHELERIPEESSTHSNTTTTHANMRNFSGQKSGKLQGGEEVT